MAIIDGDARAEPAGLRGNYLLDASVRLFWLDHRERCRWHDRVGADGQLAVAGDLFGLFHPCLRGVECVSQHIVSARYSGVDLRKSVAGAALCLRPALEGLRRGAVPFPGGAGACLVRAGRGGFGSSAELARFLGVRACLAGGAGDVGVQRHRWSLPRCGEEPGVAVVGGGVVSLVRVQARAAWCGVST